MNAEEEERTRLQYVMRRTEDQRILSEIRAQLQTAQGVGALSVLFPRARYPSRGDAEWEFCERCKKQVDMNYNYDTACKMKHPEAAVSIDHSWDQE